MLTTFLILIFIVPSVYPQNNLTIKLKADGIIPDVIPKAPSEKAFVKYGNKSVDLGNTFTPYQVRNKPLIQWTSSPSKFYTLIMIDPHAQNGTGIIFKHWLVGNIPGINVNSGETIASYLSPAPGRNTGYHQYIFLIYKQTGRIDYSGEPKTSSLSITNRQNWNMSQFLETYNLSMLIAGNYFTAKWDIYSETEIQQLAGK